MPESPVYNPNHILFERLARNFSPKKVRDDRIKMAFHDADTDTDTFTDILARIVARMSVKVSVSVSASWNASFIASVPTAGAIGAAVKKSPEKLGPPRA